MAEGRYPVPHLRGWILQQPGREDRALAVPPFWDRVLQRAAVQALTPAFDGLMYRGSFGYRRGRSRHGAKAMIQEAYAQGYTWVFEADTDDFFDSLPWEHVRNRLSALLGDDLIVPFLLRWVEAEVEYQGQRIPCNSGLPQGAPLSPLLANLLLDDFDSDMHTAGFKLVRFADDFVVLCKSEAQAIAAEQIAAASLAEVGLRLNPDKTRICTFAQGFLFLGYIFVNSLALDAGGEKPPSQAPAVPKVRPRSWQAKIPATPEDAAPQVPVPDALPPAEDVEKPATLVPLPGNS